MNTTATGTTKYDDAITLTYRTGTYYGETGDMHIIEAHDEDGATVGELYCDLTTGQIMQIEVNEDRRGEGIARLLAEHAATIFDVYHSPDEHCTPEGLAFKEAMNGETIPAELAHQPAA